LVKCEASSARLETVETAGREPWTGEADSKENVRSVTGKTSRASASNAADGAESQASRSGLSRCLKKNPKEEKLKRGTGSRTANYRA
jgi:hypothetical protein